MPNPTDEQVLRTTTNPATWDGDDLRRDARLMSATFLAFNHATMNRQGVLADVQDLRGVVSSLESIAAGLPQLLEQLDAELGRAHEAGYIARLDNDVEGRVATAHAGITGAAANIKELHLHLERAASALDGCYPSDAFHDAAGDQDHED